MDINIPQVLRDHGVYFITFGKNVVKNHVNINCPYCAGGDPSEHLGIDLTTGYWACWRNKSHSGKNLHRLLRRLGIHIEGSNYTPGDFELLLSGEYFNPPATNVIDKEVLSRLPKTFIPISDKSAIDNYYVNYIKSRGFDDPFDVIQQYNLMRCSDVASKWYNRIIIPVSIDDSITWTARSISSRDNIRYLSPKNTEAKNIKETLFNFNTLKSCKAKALIINEGPFDSIKLDYYTQPVVRATCIYGLYLAPEQLSLLKRIYTNFEKIYLAVDKEATLEGIEMANTLSFCNCQILEVSSEKDPGAMNPNEIEELISEI